MYLCDPEHLFPAEYWQEQQENVISTLPPEYRYFQSMYCTRILWKEIICRPGRNVSSNTESS